MSETIDASDTTVEEAAAPQRPKAEPIDSRFLFVDIAALRAKQLRRGALPRLTEEDHADSNRPQPHKAERVAMEEVRRGLVPYDVVVPPKPPLE